MHNHQKFILVRRVICYLLFPSSSSFVLPVFIILYSFISYIFTFLYSNFVIFIKKCTRDLVIFKPLPIAYKALSNYSLKMAL